MGAKTISYELYLRKKERNYFTVILCDFPVIVHNLTYILYIKTTILQI